ncbi:MAG: hypothetical protein DCC55_36715 [Chloroflexi bacterium]|nr:MAG: hypothetical protein DCC55_36715 [Chloroflexota bacterium]
MFTVTTNQNRISTLIVLVGWLSILVAGYALWASLGTLSQNLHPAATTNQPLATNSGPPALLLFNADALVLTLNGATTPLTVRVRDEVGRPVPGVEVRFQSDLGTVAPASATTDAAGQASATFTAGGVAGQAVVTAQLDGLTQQTAIQIVKPGSDATTHKLALEFGPGKLEHGQQATLSAVLRDASGQPVAGELVSFFGSLGEVTPASAMSDASGRVTATYRAGNIPGQAMVTALAGYSSQSATFQVGEVPTQPGDPQRHELFLPVVSR